MKRIVAKTLPVCTCRTVRSWKLALRSMVPAFCSVAVVLLLVSGLQAKDQGGTSVGSNVVPVVKETSGQSLRIPRVTRAPKLTDFLEGKPREAEAVVTDFFQMDPTDGAPVSQATTAYLSYDDKNLYVGWICKDEPAKIRARVAKRKDILNDDRITINIDTFHDHKHSYFFDVNPYGVQLDGRTTEGQGDDFSWESLWYSEGKLTEDGYVVLETIPFRSLRFPPGPVQDWGFVLARFIARNNEWSMSPPITRRLFPAWVGQFGHMQIPENVSPGRNLQFIPYGLFSNSRYLDNGSGFRTDNEGRAGLDAKMVLKDAFTLDMTVNPDFSQIESDEPQVTVNQRFEVVYPEKRPFFMENASLFKTPQQQLFFSRRIVDPQFGMKLTGTIGRWGIGVLASDDRGPGELVPADDPLHGQRAKDAIVRVERGFGEGQSHFGALVTNYDFGNSYNRVGAVDTRIELKKHWILSGQATSSVTRFRDGSYLAGPAYNVGIESSGQHFGFESEYVDRSPGFHAELGYIPRVDVRAWENWMSYKWRPKNRSIVSFGPELAQSVNWKRNGQLQDWSVMPHFSVEMLRLTNMTFLREESYELFQNIGFRKSMSEVSFSSEPFKWLALKAELQKGDGINYYPGNDLPPFLAHMTNTSAGFTLRPVPKLKIDQSYLYTRLGAERSWLPSALSSETAANAIFNNHILRTKVNYQFTRALSVRAIVDYNGVLPNQSLVSLEKSKRVGTDLLLSYFVHPGTALYVGYSNALENVAWDPLMSPNLRRTPGLGTMTGRQFFVKMSYLFRY